MGNSAIIPAVENNSRFEMNEENAKNLIWLAKMIWGTSITIEYVQSLFNILKREGKQTLWEQVPISTLTAFPCEDYPSYSFETIKFANGTSMKINTYLLATYTHFYDPRFSNVKNLIIDQKIADLFVSCLKKHEVQDENSNIALNNVETLQYISLLRNFGVGLDNEDVVTEDDSLFEATMQLTLTDYDIILEEERRVKAESEARQKIIDSIRRPVKTY